MKKVASLQSEAVAHAVIVFWGPISFNWGKRTSEFSWNSFLFRNQLSFEESQSLAGLNLDPFFVLKICIYLIN